MRGSTRATTTWTVTLRNSRWCGASVTSTPTRKPRNRSMWTKYARTRTKAQTAVSPWAIVKNYSWIFQCYSGPNAQTMYRRTPGSGKTKKWLLAATAIQITTTHQISLSATVVASRTRTTNLLLNGQIHDNCFCFVCKRFIPL